MPGIGLRRLEVALDPPFAPGYSWDVRALGPVWRLFRSEIIRESSNASTRVRGYTELDASAVELERFVLRVGTISLPLAQAGEGAAVADATTYYRAICSDHGSEARFRWCEGPLSNWRPLGDLSAEMIALFKSLVEKKG